MPDRFTAADLRRFFDAEAYARGQDLWRKRAVIRARRLSTRVTTGEVFDPPRGVHAVELTWWGAGVAGAFRSRCSCLGGGRCAHAAALLLYLAQQGEAGGGVPEAVAKPPPEPRAPRSRRRGSNKLHLDLWLDALRAAPAEETRPPRLPTPEQVFYIPEHDERGRPAIAAFKGRLRKDGVLGKTTERYTYANYQNRARFLTLEDTAVLASLSRISMDLAIGEGGWPEGEALERLLRAVVHTGRARAGLRGPTLRWDAPRRIRFDWVVQPSGDQDLRVTDADGTPLRIFTFPTLVYVDDAAGRIGFAATDLPAAFAARLVHAPPIDPESAPRVAAALAATGGPGAPRPAGVAVEEREDLEPRPTLRLRGMKASSAGAFRPASASDPDDGAPVHPQAQLRIRYDGVPTEMPPGDGDDPRALQKDRVSIIRRDRVRELELWDELLHRAIPYDARTVHTSRPGGVWSEQVGVVSFPPLSEAAQSVPEALVFAGEELSKLREEGWQVEVEDSWPVPLYEGRVDFSAEMSAPANDWFSLSLQLAAGDQRFDLAPTIVNIVEQLPFTGAGALPPGFRVAKFLEGRPVYARMNDGKHLRLSPEQLTPLVEAFLEAEGFFEYHRAEAGRAAALVHALEGCGVPWRGDRQLIALGERLRALGDARETAPPPAFRGELRPYQGAGLGWLQAVADSGFGAALADDMGLGKTVQALALLAHRHLETGSDRPSLLVAPTSLVGNWVREAARFVPDLTVLPLRGPDRKRRFAEIPEHHLVITTYPLVNRDHEALFAHEYEVALLDEAQAVKNPASAGAKRIRAIRSRARLALTGTPVENNLIELWALYDWLIPGFLGDRRMFTRNYRTPIERHGNHARQRLLSSRLRPFLLRRAKEDVETELPPKTEINEIVTLAGGQRALYETIRVVMDERVRTAIHARGLARSRIAILDALLKLRQVCCDPALVKLEAARAVRESAKFNRLFEMLEELVAEGRKVLVFSQFVKMLRLIAAEVRRRKWKFVMLHGATKKRDAVIAEFQSGDAPLFLISLRAGGVGLNLTAADTVILYDPWWNPAVERQAMDRAHRIGQDKPVFVHRLIAEHSVEAAIQEMQARKQALADALFEGGGKGPLTLTEADIAALLAPMR